MKCSPGISNFLKRSLVFVILFFSSISLDWDVQAGFRKDRGNRDQIANIHWIIKKAREFQKNIYFCFTDYTKAFDGDPSQTVENS